METNSQPKPTNIQLVQDEKSLTSIPLDDCFRSQENPVFSPDEKTARCERCREFKVVVIKFAAARLGANRVCEDCYTELVAEDDARRIAHRKANPELLLHSAGIPKRFWNCTLDNYQGYDRLKVKTRPTLISGPAGTGKTHLAVAYLREALVNIERDENGILHLGRERGHFIEAVDLFMQLRNSFGDQGKGEPEILKPYLESPFLVLDDLGAEKLSDYVRQSLYLLINRRYGDCRETIITSNLSLKQISENYGDRLASRIAGMGEELVLKGKDRRMI